MTPPTGWVHPAGGPACIPRESNPSRGPSDARRGRGYGTRPGNGNPPWNCRPPSWDCALPPVAVPPTDVEVFTFPLVVVLACATLVTPELSTVFSTSVDCFCFCV